MKIELSTLINPVYNEQNNQIRHPNGPVIFLQNICLVSYTKYHYYYIQLKSKNSLMYPYKGNDQY